MRRGDANTDNRSCLAKDLLRAIFEPFVIFFKPMDMIFASHEFGFQHTHSLLEWL